MFEDINITDDILKDAAQLFSENYGVWGPLAESKMGAIARNGLRVKMSLRKLKAECMPSEGHTIYARVLVDGTLAGNVFATRWMYKSKPMCWITQLCVSSEQRNKGLAKLLLNHLRQGEPGSSFGILSSHPFAILATLRVFGRGIEDVDFRMTAEHASVIMKSCPIPYVSRAKIHGSLFGSVEDGSVSSADTAFWVDHEEPLAALALIREKGIKWSFGDLPHGHEFLIIIKGSDTKSPSGE